MGKTIDKITEIRRTGLFIGYIGAYAFAYTINGLKHSIYHMLKIPHKELDENLGDLFPMPKYVSG